MAKQQAELRELALLRDKQQAGSGVALGKRRSKDRMKDEDLLEIEAVNRESIETQEQERIRKKVEKLR
jgi:hypothetical protein